MPNDFQIKRLEARPEDPAQFEPVPRPPLRGQPRAKLFKDGALEDFMAKCEAQRVEMEQDRVKRVVLVEAIRGLIQYAHDCHAAVLPSELAGLAKTFSNGLGMKNENARSRFRRAMLWASMAHGAEEAIQRCVDAFETVTGEAMRPFDEEAEIGSYPC